MTALAEGRTDMSGPSCLVRSMVSTASERVLQLAARALRPTAPATSAPGPQGAWEGSLLLGLHIRRGDAAMQKECPSCINADEPGVVQHRERVSLASLRESLRCVNATLSALRVSLSAQSGGGVDAGGVGAGGVGAGGVGSGGVGGVHAFVASDTAEGLAMAREVLGEHSVLAVEGAAVHSTRPRAAGGSDEALKVAADFLALAAADVHLGIGESTFWGNAAAAGLGTVKRAGDRAVGGNVCKALTATELEGLVRAFARKHAPSSGHVEL